MMRTVAAVLAAALALGTSPPVPADQPGISVRGSTFVDGYGREVVLRGFNVSGEVKLEENGGLPFASTDDARKSAEAMHRLTGANAVRFLVSWAHAEPTRGQLGLDYLARLTDQMGAFLDQGFAVIPDYHQDLYSRALFNPGSWYTGDGAPKWVVDLGGYPPESCGVCVHWGQNITQNGAVQSAAYDFWHNNFQVQDAFLDQAQRGMDYLRQHLSARQFAGVVGMDPFNEPYAGRYDSGQNSQSWERDLLWPFYQRFRQRMDAAGWQDKPAFVEPNPFWNTNISFENQPGGLLDAGDTGPRFVFNSHFYDAKAQSGVFMVGKAGDGQYTGDLGSIRDRATAMGTAAVVTEFGHPLTGFTSDKAPTVDKALYQAMDSQQAGASWWTRPSGTVLSGTQWHWDVYSGRHHELMNGNSGKVMTTGDGWNGEDYSAASTDDSGNVVLRQDERLLDRMYPNAVAGHVLAFTYEDRSRDGNTVLTWNPVPASLPTVASIVGGGQYGVLVWRSTDVTAPTELHLPRSFTAASTTVLSDVTSSRSDDKLVLATQPGTHYALIANGTTAPSEGQRAAAQAELTRWVASVLSGKI